MRPHRPEHRTAVEKLDDRRLFHRQAGPGTGLAHSRLVSYLRRLALAITIASLSACSGAKHIDAASWGGGGLLDAAKARLVASFERYAKNGLPATFAQPYGSQCYARHTKTQCDLLKSLGDNPDKSARIAAFVEANLDEIRENLNSVAFVGVDPAAIPQTGLHYARQVDAAVPLAGDVAYFSKPYVMSAEPDDLAALGLHEILHTLKKGRKKPIGDFDSEAGFDQALVLLNLAGAGAVTDPFEDAQPYRDVVLADHPVVYFPFEDFAGSPYVRNWARPSGGHRYDGVIEGKVALEQPGALATSGSSLRTVGGGSAPGSIRLELPDLTASPAVTFEAWIKWEGTAASPYNMVLFGFDGFRLAFTGGLLGGLFGFSTNVSDLVGFDAGPAGGQADHQGSLSGKWAHLVAEFVNGDSIASALYLNGKRQVSMVRLPTPLPGSFSTVARLSGWAQDERFRWPGSIDELAIYAGALSEDRIAAHFKASGLARRDGLIQVAIPAYGTVSNEVIVPFSSPCPDAKVIASSRVTSQLCAQPDGTAGACVGASGWNSTSLRASVTSVTEHSFALKVVATWPAVATSPIDVDYQATCR